MNTLLENDLPDLHSLELDEAADFERRLSALEAIVGAFTRRIENEVLVKIRSLEDALAAHALADRECLAREAAERQEQLASLAGKVSRKVDLMQRTTLGIEEKQVIVSRQVQTTVEDRIAEARQQIAEETGELRAVLQARLDELAGDA